MTNRPTVPRNVERGLWAESMGYCMNPQCNVVLVDETSIAEMAHIKPHAEGGDTSAGNLILLCRNCHRQIDDARAGHTQAILRQWKANRNSDIRRKFAQKYATFDQLRDAIVPLLKRNGDIFDDFGPATDSAEIHDEIHDLWVKFEPELIANNEQISAMLNANLKLLHYNNRDVVNRFNRHAQEFVATRGTSDGIRVNLFPGELRSIFGISVVRVGRPAHNLSALQNFITHLMENGKFQTLQLEPEQILRYNGANGTENLYLDEEYKVDQIYWNGRFYRPNTTELRLESLVFFLEWLARNGIRYEFDDFSNLTKLTLNEDLELVLCYEYCLSVSTLYKIQVSDRLIVVNLYNWNGGCITSQARDYATSQGFKVFTQNEFFKFAHRRLK